jgi:hypothetical protein
MHTVVFLKQRWVIGVVIKQWMADVSVWAKRAS